VSHPGSAIERLPLLRELPHASRVAIGAGAVERLFRVGDRLLSGGERAEWLFILERGLVREFYVSARGEEHTRVFVCEGGVTGSLLDLRSDAPSLTWIEALEPTRAFAIRFDAFNDLAARSPDIERLARLHAERMAIAKTMREYEMLALPASERLARWRRTHPHLEGRITRRLLASYLGVTPVHLSRIWPRA